MRIVGLVAASALLLAASLAAAAPLSPKGLFAPSAVVPVQAKTDESLKTKVKRTWRRIAGTTYDVGCPSLSLAFNRTTCTETGNDSRAKCQKKHPLCQVSERK